MKSGVIKRSVVISGHKTSVSLEEPFWNRLKEIAKGHQATLSDVLADIESKRQYGNLSSAIRLFVLEHARAQTDTVSPSPGAPNARGAGAQDSARSPVG
jgi:predicted DNA-binding ribbon-helix-helix protein